MCCEDSDCSRGAVCEKLTEFGAGEVGLCTNPGAGGMGGGGAGGDGGAGGSGGAVGGSGGDGGS
jgi:hypothetical protein